MFAVCRRLVGGIGEQQGAGPRQDLRAGQPRLHGMAGRQRTRRPGGNLLLGQTAEGLEGVLNDSQRCRRGRERSEVVVGDVVGPGWAAGRRAPQEGTVNCVIVRDDKAVEAVGHAPGAA